MSGFETLRRHALHRFEPLGQALLALGGRRAPPRLRDLPEHIRRDIGLSLDRA